MQVFPLLAAATKGAMQFKAILETLKTVTQLSGEARRWYETRNKERHGSAAPAKGLDNDLSSLVGDLDELRKHIGEIEADGDQQARLIDGIVKQTEALSRGLQIVAGRITALLIVSATATILGALALALVVLRS